MVLYIFLQNKLNSLNVFYVLLWLYFQDSCDAFTYIIWAKSTVFYPNMRHQRPFFMIDVWQLREDFALCDATPGERYM